MDDAERVVRFALDFNPADAGLLSVRADIAARRGHYDAAVGWLQKAIEARPGDLGLRNQMSLLHQSQHNLAAAAEAAQQALDITPDNVGMLRRMSDLSARQGDMATAFALAERVLQAAPADAVGHYHVGWLHQLRDDWAAAERAQRAAVDLAPDNAGQLRRLSDILFRRGDIAGAFEWADRATAARPDEAANHVHRAWLHLHQSELDHAEAALRTGLGKSAQ